MTDAPTRTFLADVDVHGAHLDAPFAITNAQLGKTKKGDPFLKALISDKTLRVPVRQWSITEEAFHNLPTDGFVWVQGTTQPYQGELQVIASRVDPYDPSPREIAELLPSTTENINAMFSEVVTTLNTLKHPGVAALRDAYLSDGELMDLFCEAPAAQTMHHAYLGGLLEHTRNLIRLGDAVCTLYPSLSRDLVIFGLFLHDLGKTRELTWRTGFGYTTDGNLVGHIVRGTLMLEDKARAINADPEQPDISPELLASLQHIVLSHHGIPEYGAAKLPSTPEALVIHYLDNIDAKLNIALPLTRDDERAKATNLGGDFTEKIWALDTRLYRPDPTAE